MAGGDRRRDEEDSEEKDEEEEEDEEENDVMDGVIRKGVSTHGALFSLYDVYGDPFEITAKYQPPIEPLGRGAYGIVWYSILITFLFFPSSSFLFLPCC